MKQILTFLFSVVIAGNSVAQQHLYSDIGQSVNPTSTDNMTKRIIQDAVDYAKYAPIPRLAEMDFAFGADITEYKKLNGYGVLYIPSLNQDTSEYPIKRVYIKTKDNIIELGKIGEIAVGVQNDQIKKTFGKNRVDFYYLIPYQLTQVQSELLIDWSNNRKEFLLSKFPTNKLTYPVDNKFAKKEEAIDEQFLKEFLAREFNVRLADK